MKRGVSLWFLDLDKSFFITAYYALSHVAVLLVLLIGNSPNTHSIVETKCTRYPRRSSLWYVKIINCHPCTWEFHN